MEIFSKRYFPRVLATTVRELGPEGFPMVNFLGPGDRYIISSSHHKACRLPLGAVVRHGRLGPLARWHATVVRKAPEGLEPAEPSRDSGRSRSAPWSNPGGATSAARLGPLRVFLLTFFGCAPGVAEPCGKSVPLTV